MPKETQYSRDLKKAVGSPKILFVLGGPGTGTDIYCSKLVEEFGYVHIKTGDLLRAETKKGTKEATDIKKVIDEGGLAPNHIVVQLLVQAIMAKPASIYLVEGFPRTVEQALYFEQNVVEAQQVLYFEATRDELLNAPTSIVDKETKVKNFFDQAFPVVEFYIKFGKVKRIKAM